MQDRVLDYVRAVSRVKSVLIRKHASGHSIQEKVPAEQGGDDRLVLFQALLANRFELVARIPCGPFIRLGNL